MADKRKQPPSQHGPNGRQRKRAKTRDARAIAVQSSGTAFKNGEVDVDKFVKARQYEIKALEEGMGRARKGLSQRAFQGVPRELRRRTASHNVKRVPKRLRARAAREMVEDNTPTVTARRRKLSGHMRLRLETAKRLQKLSAKTKTRRDKKNDKEHDTQVTVTPAEGHVATKEQNAVETRQPRVKSYKLKNPPTPPSKFRKRQLNKSWLPTHMFHTKRAHMTPPTAPLWRFAIPLAPTMKCYRPTHRASTTRGAVAWDTSYMSTIGLEGQEVNIEKLLKDLGVGGKDDPERIWGKKGQKWRDGSRTWEGWMFERGGWPDRPIAPVTVVWSMKLKADDVEMGDSTTTAAPPSKKKERRKAFLRVHPSAFLQLWEEVRRLNPPITLEDLRFEMGSIEITGPGATEALMGALCPTTSTAAEGGPSSVWKSLGSVTNLNTLPANVLLGFDVSDPRLHHPPRTISLPTDKVSHSHLLNILATWPPDRTQTPPAIFDRNKRLAASRSLASQKSINRRKTLTTPGAYPEARHTDPQIPILLYATRGTATSNGTWTLLLPWKCVAPTWNSLMYYPLSTGGNVRFGGLEQRRQLAFEAGVPWFPGDFPGTKAGRAWEEKEIERRKSEWKRRPKGKRIEWESLLLADGRRGEAGKGWACDWSVLATDNIAMSDADKGQKSALYQLPLSLALEALKQRSSDVVPNPSSALITVQLALVTRGVPTTCARIYRLPTHDPSLRQKWLSLLPEPRAKKAKSTKPSRPPPSAPPHLHQAYLAAKLLTPASDNTQAGTNDYPPVPDVDDMIGFVTAGNFNLGEGKATAVGSILLEKLLTAGSVKMGRGEERLCIVRNAGETVGRLARWEVV